MFNTPAEQDLDGSYLLRWDAGWYCIWVTQLPHTGGDRCREYRLTFSWTPLERSVAELWSGATWSRGCQTYPNRYNPGACFGSASRGSVGAVQSITVVATERSPSGPETEVFRAVVPIKFTDR